MVGRVKVFGGVLVLRGIAAANVPADEAETQMNPAIACLETILAAVRAWSDLLDLIEMRAVFRSHSLLFHNVGNQLFYNI